MLTKNKLMQSQVITCITQLPLDSNNCLNSLMNGLNRVLKIKSLTSSQKNEDGQGQMYLNSGAMGLFQLIDNLRVCPHTNGTIPFFELAPRLNIANKFMHHSGLINLRPDLNNIDENNVIDLIRRLQRVLLTEGFAQKEIEWKLSQKELEKCFEQLFKEILKQNPGFDIRELVCRYPMHPHLMAEYAYSTQNEFAVSRDQEIARIIYACDKNQVCGVAVKHEITSKLELVRRYFIITGRQYIDSPTAFTDTSFVQEIKNLVEPHSNNTVTLETTYLNGLLQNNQFLKKSPDFKDQMKLLKMYMVGTDSLIRIGGTKPTFEVLFSRYSN